MTDITDRLRAAVPKLDGIPVGWRCEVRSELLLEAASEVERLRAKSVNSAWLLAEVERLQGLLRGLSRDMVEEIKQLTRERDEARAEVERLRVFEVAHPQIQSDLDAAIRERNEARAEVERLTRERNEARAALKPFSELYLWPDDAGRLIAERVRSHEDWDEVANDEESNPYCILRGEIRAARKALEAKQ